MQAAATVSLPVEIDVRQWGDWRWRLSNLYYIQDERGQVVKFVPNTAQLELLEEWWYLNVILKARQLGFTTLIDLLALDQCVFVPSYAAGIIAHNLDDAEKIFRRKVKFPYENLPEGIRYAVSLKRETTSQLVFSNDSEISVGVSMRSGTMQFLHVSEFGKICAKYPAKAEEIVTGSFNAVHQGQIICVESTAEGRYGDFYEMVQQARALQDEDNPLTELDFKFHFFPWWADKRNRMDPTGVAITKELRIYFRQLAREHRIVCDARQQAWYAKKLQQHQNDWDLMKRENPSHPDEAFEAAIEGSYYGKMISKMRTQGRIRYVPWIESEPVNTFWDLGRNDMNVLWFHQFVAGEHRFIDYYENSGEALKHYYDQLVERREEGWLFGRHYLPHDAENKNLERNESREDRLVELGMDSSSIVIVEKIEDINVGIELVRKALPNCWFDKERCDLGLKRLEEYRKEWDERQATFKNYPAHTIASNGADAFRQFAQGWRPAPAGRKGKVWDRDDYSKRRNVNYRTA